MQLQTQLMNLAFYRLSMDVHDSLGLSLLLAGTTLDQEYWQDPLPRQTCWDGNFCDQLIVWDDQGFGDTLQNLGWIAEAARRVGSLRIWLRPALLPLVRACLPLPANCQLEALDLQSSPWRQGAYQTASFTFPSFLSDGLRKLRLVLHISNYLQRPILNQCRTDRERGALALSGALGATRPPSRSVMPGCVMCQSTPSSNLLRSGGNAIKPLL